MGFEYYIAALGLMVFSLIVQANLKSKAAKGSKVVAGSYKTANQVVEEMLRSHGIYDITIDHRPGQLTDCYSPKENKIYLSDTTYNQNTVTAIAVAAHEAGHAVQDAENMFIYRIRQMLAPVAGFASQAGFWLTILGVMIAGYSYNQANNGNAALGYAVSTFGVIVYSVSFLFYLVMLPVERNASNRAYKDMKEYRWVSEDQKHLAYSVLRAAGDTYAIALASSALTLFRLLLIRGGGRNRR